jgi:oxygen-independent coproporphyrinogen-3 oxidase
MAQYLVALRREIEQRAPLAEGRAVETVFFGGGTPTLYPVEDLAEVLEGLRGSFRFASERAAVPDTGLEACATPEVTCEANPGTVDEAYLRALREAGVNRLSLGVQSFRDDELRLLGRLHSADQARAAVAAARAAGFANLSLDLIAGLPGQTLAAWEYNLASALALAPEHLSCYGLSLPPGTPLAAAVERCELTPLDEDLSATLWMVTHETLTAAGYEHYEVSNYARPGYQCRHNLTYWRNREYLGFGVSAASYWQGNRSVNVADVADYSRRLAAGESVVAESECLPPAARLGETLMLGLRLAEGVSLARLREGFSPDLLGPLQPIAEELRQVGLLEITPTHWRPTLRGMLLNNRLAGAFV